MRRFLCVIFCIAFLLSVTSCEKKTVLANDAVMLAYEGDTPGTEFDHNFSEDFENETIQAYLASYEPITVHEGETIILEIDGAVYSADAIRVCYMDADGNEVKYIGNATLDQNVFSDDRIEIDTDWWYNDPEFAGQHTTWAYWIDVSLPGAADSTRIYYLRVTFV